MRSNLISKDTERQGHAIEIAKEINIEKFDTIVTVSGDGVIHEVINGFLQRPDAREAIRKLPLGVIPGGTGNALSISILGEKAGFDPQYTALQVIKGAQSSFSNVWRTMPSNIRLLFRKTYDF